jgi:hypothetical protein
MAVLPPTPADSDALTLAAFDKIGMVTGQIGVGPNLLRQDQLLRNRVGTPSLPVKAL